MFGAPAALRGGSTSQMVLLFVAARVVAPLPPPGRCVGAASAAVGVGAALQVALMRASIRQLLLSANATRS